MRLNLGCGSQCIKEGWVNVDYALGARLFKLPLFRSLNQKIRLFNLDWNPEIYIHDLTKPFPWQDESVEVVYSSHTLEHFTKEEGRRFLAECHRVLRPSGIIRIVVPDLRVIIDEYVTGKLNADDFVARLGVLYEPREGPIKSLLARFVQFPHKCMYDVPGLIAILQQLDFDAKERAAFDSDIADIHMIELESRTKNAVIVEGRKN